MSVSARAFWTMEPGRGELREERLKQREAFEVLIETLYSGVSRGTEALVFNGRVPKAEYQRMRCPHQSGDFPGPVKYGYSNVGRVIEGPAHLLGRAVFALYPHQTAYVISEASVIAIPDGVPPERCVLAANLETAINAIWDARPLLGDRVTVVGAGVVGALCAYLLRRMFMSHVELVDVRTERERLARALGVEFATPDTARHDRDLVLHASGRAEGLQAALKLSAPEATLIELSWYGSDLVALALGEDFHVKRLTLRSSQVGSVSPNARPRFAHRSRLEYALSLCGDEVLDCLFTSQASFEILPESMRELATGEGAPLCHRVHYGAK